MQLQEGLTKENFFNHLREKYPKAMKVFCNWIDEYKKAADWDKLFSNSTKFHDLPLAMQDGIWMEFVRQQHSVRWDADYYTNPINSLRENIKNWMNDKDFQNL